MQQKTFSFVVGIIFVFMAILHLMRIIFRWEATIANWTVPLWISWVAILVAGYLAWQGFRLGKKPEN